jgi:hypothetical protein
MSFSRLHAVLSTPLLLVLTVAAFTDRQGGQERFKEITVERINVVDSAGSTRVILAGGFPPRRAALAGLLFVNEDGHESGGLVYRGTRDENGDIQAGGILTFDQYRNDQIVALHYEHQGDRKRQGLTFQERPDTLSNLMKEFYRAFESAPDAAARDSVRRHYLAVIPPEDRPARRLFLGREFSRASVITLSDIAGNPRLRLQVDSLGQPSITFLDEAGQPIRTITH